MEAGDGVICSVNYAGVIGKLLDHGLSEAVACDAWAELPLAIEALTAETALAAGRLRKSTRAAGLSLVDRCCLALGRVLGAPVITADKAWQQVKDARVTLIR